ncbi:MAG: CDP-alcohol phosphatidyltransferase family protein, partial [Planctomycetes bacterium]|nr:CDP-alcohol phosphatidyltransferase family protein [Planctomycetota bacterium]
RLTIPNLICVGRLAGSLALIAIALAGHPLVFVVGFVILAFTDWIDGELAIALDQRTLLGARLDSAADAAMYASLLFGAVWLKYDALLTDWIWIAAALITYGASHIASYLKFRRLASYHTRAAKTSAFFTLLAAIALFADWPSWPLWIAMTAITLTNLEAVAITLVLREWRTDVVSIYHAVRDRDIATGTTWNSP